MSAVRHGEKQCGDLTAGDAIQGQLGVIQRRSNDESAGMSAQTNLDMVSLVQFEQRARGGDTWCYPDHVIAPDISDAIRPWILDAALKTDRVAKRLSFSAPRSPIS